MKYVYPAVFSKEDDAYNVSFPDLPGCLTFGIGMKDATEMAVDALSLYLYSCEIDKLDIPTPSDATAIQKENPNDIIVIIACDTTDYGQYVTEANDRSE